MASSGEDEPLEPPPKRRRGAALNYVLDRRFLSAAHAAAWLEHQDDWTRHMEQPTSEGVKLLLRCKAGKAKAQYGGQCPARACIVYPADSQAASLFIAEGGHVHGELQPRQGLDDATKDLIRQLWEDGIRKPAAITQAFRTRGIPEPPLPRLRGHLARLRRQLYGPATVSIAALQAWAEGKEELPEELDQPFLAAKELSHELDEEPVVRLFLTTRRLLTNATHADLLSVDATYKLNFHGYPVLMAGVIDSDKKYHPLGVALCITETGDDFAFLCQAIRDSVLLSTGHDFQPRFLLADAAAAITNGAREAFGDFVRLTCWFHAAKKIEGRLRRLPAATASAIYNAVCLLQLSRGLEEFLAGVELLRAQYVDGEDAGIAAFFTYLDEEWLTPQRRLWFEGAGPNRPSTNNALESLNGHLKTGHTLRNRLPILEFLGGLQDRLLPAWSKDRGPDCPTQKTFAQLPTLSTATWSKAYAFAHENRQMLSRREGDQRLYFIKATGGADLTEEVLEGRLRRLEERSWGTWEEYAADRKASWQVKLVEADWRLATCDCPVYVKDYVCKHSLGIPIRLRLPGVQVPDAAKTLPLGQRRRRGRPAHARRALLIQ
jgi:hypothetical protein